MAKRRHHHKKRHHHRNRAHNRAHNPRRSGMLMSPNAIRNLMGGRRNRHHHRRHHNRRRNPFGINLGRELLPLTGGALVGGFGSRLIPGTFLKAQNTGWMGYFLNLLSGGVLSWGGGEVFKSPEFATGGYVGTLLATAMRIAVEQFSIGGTALQMSRDMDFDLAYYTSDRFPYPQGSGGPYDRFPGTPSLANPPFPATAASAVRAGAAAAAAALPPGGPAAASSPGVAGISNGRWAGSRWN
ncbi:MAG TPA: hypothetical protein VNJ12_11230 [Candidatus Dormibacteraeota bacterium]|nr:hypothetical protein [Candidatus Dormibacteraeota bacterium]